MTNIEQTLPNVLQGAHVWNVSSEILGKGAFSTCRLATCNASEDNVVPAVVKTTFLSPIPAARAKQLLYVRREVECLQRLIGNVNVYVFDPCADFGSTPTGTLNGKTNFC
jgi:hypothetical protein